LGEAYLITYTPLAITKAFATTGTWPVNPEAIKPEKLAPSLVTQQPTLPQPSAEQQPSKKHTSRNAEIEELKRRVAALEEEVQYLKHPGTSSLATVLRYPLQKAVTDESKPRRAKTFTFSRILTDEEAMAESRALEEEEKKKTEDKQKKKELRMQKQVERAQVLAERQAEKARKKNSQEKQKKQKLNGKKKKIDESDKENEEHFQK
jgi:hypothetical protein